MFKLRFISMLIICGAIIGLMCSISKFPQAAQKPTQLISSRSDLPERDELVKEHIHSYLIHEERYEMCDMPSCMNMTYSKKPNMYEDLLRCFDDSGNCVSERRIDYNEKDTFFVLQTTYQYNEKGKLVRQIEHSLFLEKIWDEGHEKMDSSIDERDVRISELANVVYSFYKRYGETNKYIDSTLFNEKGDVVGEFLNKNGEWKKTYECKLDSLSRIIYSKKVDDYDSEKKTTIITTRYFPNEGMETETREYNSIDSLTEPYNIEKRKFEKNGEWSWTTISIQNGMGYISKEIDSICHDNFGNLVAERKYNNTMDTMIREDDGKLQRASKYGNKFTLIYKMEMEYDFANDRISKVKTFQDGLYSENIYVYKPDNSGTTIERWLFSTTHPEKAAYYSRKWDESKTDGELMSVDRFGVDGHLVETRYYNKGHLGSRSFYSYQKK